MAEREVLLDAVFVGVMHERGSAQATPAFRAFGLAKMSSARLFAQDLAASGDFEPLGHRFLGFDAFGASHK